MKKFLSKIIIFFFLSIPIPLMFIIYFETNTKIRNKMHSLHIHGYNITLEKIKNYQQKKILFVGGSNLGFGLSSKKIEDSLGVKTFNLGVHGGIGIKKPIEDISEYLNSNDIVIFSPEYSNFDLNHYSDVKNRVRFLNGIGFLKIKDVKSFFHYIEHIKTKVFYYGSIQEHQYNINWFNENGDVIYHYNKPNRPFSLKFSKDNINTDLLKELKSFIESKLNGISYYVIPPATNELRFNLKEEKELNQKLLKIFKEKYPLSIKSLTFKKECFYDSEYHLNYNSMGENTETILEFLKTLNIL